MKALITGVNGFVGRYLTEYLLVKNIEVSGTYLTEIKETDKFENIQLYKMEASNFENVKKVIEDSKPDLIFHLAAQSSAAISWKKPQDTMGTNVNGTINLLEAIKDLKMNPKILLIGSSEEYGFVKVEDIPVSEKQSLEPGNPYAISKIAQNLIGKLYAHSFNMNITMVRSFNHIGPGQSPVFVVSDFAKRIAEIEKGIAEPVLYVGNLEAERDFTDVRDIVKAYYEVVFKGEKGQIYNVGSGNSYKIKEILNMLISHSKMKIEVKNDPNKMRPSDVPIIRCDNTKLIKATGWRPEHTIEKTVIDVLDYWRKTV